MEDKDLKWTPPKTKEEFAKAVQEAQKENLDADKNHIKEASAKFAADLKKLDEKYVALFNALFPGMGLD